MTALFSLAEKTALIPGGTGVLGLAIAAAMRDAGAQVVVASRSSRNVDAAVSQLREKGSGAWGVCMDACDGDSVREGLAEAESLAGPVSILVNAAGGNLPDATAIVPDRTFFDLDVNALRKVVDLNLFGGALVPSMIVGKAMAERNVPSSIVNITSATALRPVTRVAGYAAAKAAAANATEWMAIHFAHELKVPIRVNALLPGFFLTEQNRFLLTNEDGSLSERGQSIVSGTPMRRFGEAHELGGAAVFLASQAASFVTGTTLIVDGGFNVFAGV